MPKGDSLPAFPSIGMANIGEQHMHSVNNYGMSLRDYFAAHAMIAIMSSELSVASLDSAAVKQNVGMAELLAESSYRYADAMLRERVE